MDDLFTKLAGRIGLGTNRISDTKENRSFLQQAVEAGLNFIDTAHIYSGGDSETAIGNALSPFPDNLIVATKGGIDSGVGNNQPDFLRANLEDSLRRLQTDCIELYQIHRLDPAIPIQQTMELLKTFQAEGKIKHIGLSEVRVEQIQEAQKYAKITSVQNHFNLTNRQHEAVLDYCKQNDIIFIPFFPLRDINGDSGLQNKLQQIANKYNANPQQVVLAWMLKKSPATLPITGTLSLEHLKDNLASVNIELSDEDFQAIDSIN